ncbi:hypothetical protein RJ639_011066 [Escallonia herrerae]|uniref:Uncharacterized protein n=1 Tax=Escallonia herrerae TaxID=1293975 RepID=A0AA89AQD6_9ASTE|nr:hypothetical protein RJ639_011066 [Escallonia herrerae]
MRQSARAEFCSVVILLRQNCVQHPVTLLRQRVRERFCSGRTVFGRLALCSGRVFRNDSAGAESCSAVWHCAQAECSGMILLGQNRVRPFGTLLRHSVRERFCSGRIVCLRPVLGQNRVRPFSTLLGQSARFMSTCDVKDQAEDEANPKPWYTADEKSSKMSTEDLVELLWEYPLPVGWYARLPHLQEPANHGTKYETGIYEEQVKSGYRLPLHPFALRFFEHYHMAPGQLVPNGWSRQRLLKGGQKSNKGWHSRYFFIGHSNKGKLPFDREWNPYCKDFENPGKPAPNNLTKHILSHIKLRGGLSIDEPLSEQQLEWARIIPRMPIPAGAITPPPAPTISSTFPAESAPLLSVDEDPIFHPRWTLRCDDVGMPDSQILEQHLVHEVLPRDNEVFQNQTHETFAYSFAQAVGSKMLSRFEMARQVTAEEAQQKREAIKEAEKATRRAQELSKQETNYLAQIEILKRRMERGKRRVAEEVKKARDQSIRDFLDGNAGDEWLKKREDDGLEIYELGFVKAKEMFAERFPDIPLDEFVLPAVIYPSGETFLPSEAGDAVASHPLGEGPSGNTPEP